MMQQLDEIKNLNQHHKARVPELKRVELSPRSSVATAHAQMKSSFVFDDEIAHAIAAPTNANQELFVPTEEIVVDFGQQTNLPAQLFKPEDSFNESN